MTASSPTDRSPAVTDASGQNDNKHADIPASEYQAGAAVWKVIAGAFDELKDAFWYTNANPTPFDKFFVDRISPVSADYTGGPGNPKYRDEMAQFYQRHTDTANQLGDVAQSVLDAAHHTQTKAPTPEQLGAEIGHIFNDMRQPRTGSNPASKQDVSTFQDFVSEFTNDVGTKLGWSGKQLLKFVDSYNKEVGSDPHAQIDKNSAWFKQLLTAK